MIICYSLRILAPLNLSGLLVTNPPLTMPQLSLSTKPSLASQTPPSLTLTPHRGLGKLEPDLCPNKLRCTWSSLICSISVKSSVGSAEWHRATTRHLRTFLSICQQIWLLLPHKFPPINIPSAQRTNTNMLCEHREQRCHNKTSEIYNGSMLQTFAAKSKMQYLPQS